MNKQANSKDCFICGVDNPVGLNMKFYNSAPGEVIATYIVPKQYESYPGVVHGGILAAMLDETAGRVFTVGEEPNFLVTAQLSIRYRKPVPSEQPLTLKGHAISNHGKVRKAKAEIYDAQGQVLTEAEAVLAEIPVAISQQFSSSENFWKTIPDEETPS
jgi:uncharacterized protein (TIGR00369 family)